MTSPTRSKKKSKTKTEKLPSGVYRNNGSLWIRFTDENGKQQRESAHTDNIAVAEAFVISKRNNVKAHRHPVAAVILGEINSKSMTYSQFLNDEVIGYYPSIKYKAQYKTVKYCLDGFAKLYGHILIRDIGILQLTSYRNHKYPDNNGSHNATLNRHRSYVLASLTHAVSHKYYSRRELIDLTLDVRFQFRPLRRVILQFFDC